MSTQSARLNRADHPLVVDLGYGRHPVTTLELADRLADVRSDIEVLGVEIDRERVAAATRYARPGLRFVRGGFNLPSAGRSPVLVRAMNVLRQYSEADAADAWQLLCGQLDADGILVEGTSDELGRRATWVTLDAAGPRTLTFAARPSDIERPSDLAERLPKALIHHHVEGTSVHRLLRDWDRAWSMARAAPSARERWVASVATLAQGPWHVGRNPARWRLGELTVAWTDVAP